MSGGKEGEEGRRERAEEMSDEPLGINQTLLKSSTQLCHAPSSEQGFPPAEKGAENSYPSLPPTSVPPHPSLRTSKSPSPPS